VKRLAIVLLVAACGASANQNPNTNTPGPNMECRDETSSTSAVPRQVCRPKATNPDGSPTIPGQPPPPAAAPTSH
jgi:hypothetical protein